MSIKAIIFDKDGTLFPYSLWGRPIENLWKVEMPLEKLDDKKKKECISALSHLVGVHTDGTINKNGLFFKRNYLISFLSLVKVTLSFRLNPFKATKGFFKIKDRENYGIEEELNNYDFSNLKEILFTLKMNEIELALFTNDSPSSTSFIEKLLGENSFQYVVNNQSKVKKPNPKAVLLYAKEKAISPEDIAIISDSIRDLKMGEKARIGKIVGLQGTEDEKDLIKHSDYVASNIEEAIDFLI